MIINGQLIAAQIQANLQELIASIEIKPCLAVIIVGENPASQVYVKRKIQACQQIGIISKKIALPLDTPEENLLNYIRQLNEASEVDGILVQLPLPPHIHPFKIAEAIAPDKDIDGFHPLNMGKLLIGKQDGFVPCTPLGIQTLLENYALETKGKQVVILGRSNIVGKPLAALLVQNTSFGNATVTLAHSHTKHLSALCLTADILVAASGQPRLIQASMVKEGAVVIDVGITRIVNSSTPTGFQLVGDVDFEQVAPKCVAITPVPGGVGPMTIAMLLQNTYRSFTQRQHKD